MPQIRDIGSGNFGVAKLMRDITAPHGELVAIKFIPRGDKVSWGASRLMVITDKGSSHSSQIDKNVEREIINHRLLLHPNIIRFREVRCCSCPVRASPPPGVFDALPPGHRHGVRRRG